jgi:hypothetical protein
MRKDDPVTCAKYAIDNGLLETPGWNSLKRITKNQKTFTRILRNTSLVYAFHSTVAKPTPSTRQTATRYGKKPWRLKWANWMSMAPFVVLGRVLLFRRTTSGCRTIRSSSSRTGTSDSSSFPRRRSGGGLLPINTTSTAAGASVLTLGTLT